MTTAGLVLYKTPIDDVQTVLRCLLEGGIAKVYVVDNSPADDLREMVAAFPKEIVEYTHGHGNVGYGEGNNIAIEKAVTAGSRYHIIINPDVVFDREVVAKMREYMDDHPQVGALTPRIVNSEGELQYLCKLLPSPANLLARRFIRFNRLTARLNLDFEMHASGYDKEMFVPFMSGCFIFARAEVLDRIGGFDERYFMFCEDIDISRRINMAGSTTVYLPGAQIIHAHKREPRKNITLDRAHMRSAITYFNRYGWFFDSYRRRTNRAALRQFDRP